MDDRTINIEGYFGTMRDYTEEQYIKIWTNHAYELKKIGVDVVETTKCHAQDEFNRLYEKTVSRPRGDCNEGKRYE